MPTSFIHANGQQATEGLLDAIQILRAGEVVERKAEFGLDATAVISFGVSVTLGNPNVFTAGDIDEEAFTANISTLGNLVQEKQGATFAAQNFEKRDWKEALKWFMENIAPLLIPLIMSEQS